MLPIKLVRARATLVRVLQKDAAAFGNRVTLVHNPKMEIVFLTLTLTESDFGWGRLRRNSSRSLASVLV